MDHGRHAYGYILGGFFLCFIAAATAAATITVYTWYLAPIPDFSVRVDGQCYVTDRMLTYVVCPEGKAFEEFVRNIPFFLIMLFVMAIHTFIVWGPMVVIAAIVAVIWRYRSHRPGKEAGPRR